MNDELNEQLRKCPFCGCPAFVDQYGHRYTAICGNCFAELGTFEDKEDCIKTWNNRPLEDEKDKEIDSLKVELDNLRNFCDSILGMAKRNNGVLYFKQDSGTWKIETDNNVGSMEE